MENQNRPYALRNRNNINNQNSNRKKVRFIDPPEVKRKSKKKKGSGAPKKKPAERFVNLYARVPTRLGKTNYKKHKDYTPAFLPCTAFDGSWQADVMNIGMFDVFYTDGRMTKVEITDFNPPFGNTKHNAMFVMIEITSRYLIILPLAEQNEGRGGVAARSRDIAEKFKTILPRYRPYISNITTDYGLSNAEYNDLDIVCKEEGIGRRRVPSEHHTTLTRVNRVMRTIREMLGNWFNRDLTIGPKVRYNWYAAIKNLVDEYNTSPKTSLVLETFDPVTSEYVKEAFTPTQVLVSPELSAAIRKKDFNAKKENLKNLKIIEEHMKHPKSRTTYEELPFEYKIEIGYDGKAKPKVRWNSPMYLERRYGNRFIPYLYNENENEIQSRIKEGEDYGKIIKWGPSGLNPISYEEIV